MRVVLLGNHSVGVEVLNELLSEGLLVGVIAHPIDPEDGSRYKSVYATAVRAGIPVVRGKPSDDAITRFLRHHKPDLLWLTDYRYILHAAIIRLATLGGVNLHPSLLPNYRGRAPINWAIINGETRLGLTAHWIDTGVDTGDIIEQQSFELHPTETVADALRKLMPLYRSVTRSVLNAIRDGTAPRIPQGRAPELPYKSRKPEDGRVDWSQSATDINNLIRAVTRPYPGAFTFCGSKKIFVWSAAITDPVATTPSPPGTIIHITSEAEPIVQCGAGHLRLIELSTERNAQIRPMTGEVFA